MSTFEILGLVTNEAKRREQHGIATGTCVKITHFSVGNQGSDPADPFNALTPNLDLTDPIDQVIFPPIPVSGVIEDQGSELSPIYILDLPIGVATGVLTSIYLWATVINDESVEAELNANDPPFSALDPTPAGFLPLNQLSGVPLFEDLPTEGNNFGDARIVAVTDLNYYWNGTTWKVIHERFLFAIANTPYNIKFDQESDQFRMALQY